MKFISSNSSRDTFLTIQRLLQVLLEVKNEKKLLHPLIKQTSANTKEKEERKKNKLSWEKVYQCQKVKCSVKNGYISQNNTQIKSSFSKNLFRHRQSQKYPDPGGCPAIVASG